MAERTTSLLLLDAASLRRSLNALASGAGDRLSDKASAWVGALESGEIVAPQGRRKIIERRCYGGGDTALARARFNVVDVTGRGPATEVQMAIDAVDALGEDFDEIILMLASAAVLPILGRLSAAGQSTLAYADGATGALHDVADAVVTADRLATLLAPEAAAATPVDREQVEAFARKVAAATNVPLLSPRAYAQLFSSLAEEITENGYDVRTTAQNVTERLAAIGRTIPRRQVVFVVKGLALKGHVFTVGETAHHLAEVFGEQVRYLMDHAGVAADEGADRLLTAWLIDRTRTPIRSAASSASAANAPQPATEPSRTAGRTKPRPKAERKKTEGKPAQRRSADTGSRKRADRPEADGAGAAPEPRQASTPRRDTPREPGIRSAEQIKSEIAARIAAAVEDRRAAARVQPAADANGQGPRARPAESAAARTAARRAAEREEPEAPAPEHDDEPLENSILAAIAEAVDVLVDKDRTDEPPPASRGDDGADRPRPPPEPEPPAPAAGDDDEAGDDIGDEIQRIIASFGRRRNGERT